MWENRKNFVFKAQRLIFAKTNNYNRSINEKSLYTVLKVAVLNLNYSATLEIIKLKNQVKIFVKNWFLEVFLT